MCFWCLILDKFFGKKAFCLYFGRISDRIGTLPIIITSLLSYSIFFIFVAVFIVFRNENNEIILKTSYFVCACLFGIGDAGVYCQMHVIYYKSLI